nr:DHH family phosphoesterase [Motilibacter deserti]
MLAHTTPDGDALGSSLAVAHALRRLGHRPRVSWGDEPFRVPRPLRSLPGAAPADGLVVAPAELAVTERTLVLVFDCASGDRLGVLRPVLERAALTVAFDHHASHVPFTSERVVDAAAPATAAIAYDLVRNLGVDLTPEIATCLYAGLVTDTGSFRFSNTTPDTLRLAARLLDTGVRHAELARTLMEDVPGALLPVLGAALQSVALDPAALGGAGLVTAVVPADARRPSGLSVDEVHPVLDVVRRAEEADVACVVYEGEPGRWRVSLRSKGAVDVARAAVSLGGGGHRAAAGLSAAGEAHEVLAQVRRALEASAAS